MSANSEGTQTLKIRKISIIKFDIKKKVNNDERIDDDDDVMHARLKCGRSCVGVPVGLNQRL